ncbi:hypothetical protein AB0L65_45355 [Nonomuraea sp. NPDC052116]|uniref:DUF3885 domain-containing protein n=1 Tax=Nonomuraea sp. NPDC052116 TaxID=3155665 RepID=UPI0034325282
MPARELPDPALPSLSAQWRLHWPDCPPLGHELRCDPDRWVRFHSLPNSKRYAETETEYQTILHRHNTVLSEMFAGQELYVTTVTYVMDEGFTDPTPFDAHALNPGSRPWTRVREDDASDPVCTMHVHIGRQQWEPGALDALLRAVADDQCNGIIIMDIDLRRVYHPYDGGADVIMADADERDQLKAAHVGWLPQNRHGL